MCKTALKGQFALFFKENRPAGQAGFLQRCLFYTCNMHVQQFLTCKVRETCMLGSHLLSQILTHLQGIFLGRKCLTTQDHRNEFLVDPGFGSNLNVKAPTSAF